MLVKVDSVLFFLLSNGALFLEHSAAKRERSRSRDRGVDST